MKTIVKNKGETMKIVFEAEIRGLIKHGDNDYVSTVEFRRGGDYSSFESIRIPFKMELGQKMFVVVTDTNPDEENENILSQNGHLQPVDFPIVGAAASKTLEKVHAIGVDIGYHDKLD